MATERIFAPVIKWSVRIDRADLIVDVLRTLEALLNEGYADRIHLSHDAACFYDLMVGNPSFADEKPDYLLLSREVIPRMLQGGTTPAQIDQMMVENARRFLCG